MTDFHFSEKELTFFLAVVWASLGFFLYYFFSMNNGPGTRAAARNGDPGKASVYQVLLQRLWGVLFLGLVPALWILFSGKLSFHDFGFSTIFANPIPWWSWLLVAGILLLGYFNSGAKGNLEHYPMIRVQHWSYSLVLLSALSWIAYLVAYEFFFRGILLYSSLSLLGPWPAIALNISIYAFAHMYKGAGEAFGALPLGVVFCLITLITGNIWTVTILHVIMALSNEWFSLWKHPGMKIIKQW
ncbi:MAG: CPBP family intramembrane glutamic endopeptidase [Bacteroidota bacterium]